MPSAYRSLLILEQFTNEQSILCKQNALFIVNFEIKNLECKLKTV